MTDQKPPAQQKSAIELRMEHDRAVGLKTLADLKAQLAALQRPENAVSVGLDLTQVPRNVTPQIVDKLKADIAVLEQILNVGDQNAG